jgi:hypothetical protein
MGRSGFGFAVLILILLSIAALPGCGGSNGVSVSNYPVPASVSLNPSPYSSVEVGQYVSFTTSATDSTGHPITEPISYQSSNTAVLTVASNGLACGGSWDSLTNPQICTPGSTGTAQVSAYARGVSSPATTVFVHQHIDNISVSIVPAQTNPPGPCYSKGQALDFQATAYSHGVDITSTVGQFAWLAVTSGVTELNTLTVSSTNQPVLNQVQASAFSPGTTPFFASVSGVNSTPFNFTTCAVQSISLQVTNSSSSSETIVPTVLDTLGTTITGVPLTWSSSQSASVSVSNGAVSSAGAGGAAAIVGSCTPPTCNIGFLPSLPIYPESVVTMAGSSTTTGTGGSGSGGTHGSGGGSGSTTPATTLFVTSTGCGTSIDCLTGIAVVNVPANTLGSPGVLRFPPNSFVFDSKGDKAYLGTNSGLLGSAGLIVLNPGATPPTLTPYVSAPGKVLAVSPDGSKVVISDTIDTPNEVFIFDTNSNAPTTYAITGATAADFSPDSLKAYILAGTTLYVYSKVDGLQTIPLSAPANDVSFLSEGAFAYLAGGSPSAVTVRRTCDNGTADTLTTPAIPAFIKTLPDATRVLAVDPPNIDLIAVNTTPSGCTPTVSDSLSSVNLGQGNFVPTQLIVSEDGQAAYILTSNLNSVLVFNISGQLPSSISLAGNATPVQAALTPDGMLLYVVASDGLLHVLSTVSGGDFQQIAFPQGFYFCQNSVGGSAGFTCNPDLLALKP